jgi:hypothetical protein
VSGLLPALGAGANSVVQLAAGGLSGVLAMSALIATGVVAAGPPPAGPQTLALVGCPGSGTVVAVARPGDQLWVTGRSADGAWFRVYVPGPARNDGWVPASIVNLLADGSALPVAGCLEAAVVPPTAVPATLAPTATATSGPTATPTAKPTARPTAAPTPTPTPTATPNPGPRFTTQPYSDVATMNTNPLGTGNCAYALGTGLTTKATDADGVTAIQLWVRKPGATSYKRFSHDFTNNGATWNNFINAKDDGVTTAGTLSWYALAIDGTGAQTKSTIRSIKIVRCDTEASIVGGINLPPYQYGPGYVLHYRHCDGVDSVSVPWRISLADGDGLTQARLTYTVRSASGVTLTSGSPLLSHVGSYWTASSGSFDAYAYNVVSVAWHVATTDRFGGKTTGAAHTDTVTTNDDC